MIANDRQRRIMAILKRTGRPLNVHEVTQALGEHPHKQGELNRHSLRLMELAGWVTKSGSYRKTYAPVEGADLQAAHAVETERMVFEVPDRGFDGITDPDVAVEVEAEKVWALAGVIRAANTAWGIDAGIDADVMEARALMAEARRQVRDDAPLGEHYRAGDPAAGSETSS